MSRILIAAIMSVLMTDCSGLTKLGGEPQGAAVQIEQPSSSSSEKPVCRGRQLAQQKAERIVATIKSKFPALTLFGAGILLSRTDSATYVLTARHVVRDSSAGTAHIEVTITNADGSQKSIPAQIVARFTPPPQFPDLALLQADPTPLGDQDWNIVRDPKNLNDLKGFVVIGNPAAEKMTTPPGDADFNSSTELRINSGVMQQGYSGGGVFDASRHLAGIVHSDGGQFAVGYPIEPILKSLESAGIPVELKTAPAGNTDVFLSDLEASSPELKQAALSAVGKAMVTAGFEPFCPSAGGYKLSIVARAIKTSGSTATIELRPTFLSPSGGALQIEKEEVTLAFVMGFSPLNSPSELETKLTQGASNLIAKLVSKMGKA